MKNQPVAFWVWNSRESKMTMTPKRVASDKAPLNTRVLQSLSGRLMYRKAETFIRKHKRNQREAKIWAQKFGGKV